MLNDAELREQNLAQIARIQRAVTEQATELSGAQVKHQAAIENGKQTAAAVERQALKEQDKVKQLESAARARAARTARKAGKGGVDTEELE